MSKAIGFAVALCCALIATPAGAAPEDAVLAPIHQFADGMNAGDFKKAGAAYAASASIIDEFAPHHWNSFAAWLRDTDAFFKASGVTGLHIGYDSVGFKQLGAKQSYVVMPTTLTYDVKGKPTTEKGIFTFSLAKGAKGWRITGWAWTTL